MYLHVHTLVIIYMYICTDLDSKSWDYEAGCIIPPSLLISNFFSSFSSSSSRPLPSSDLLKKICEVSGDDHSAVALTQEILVYLAMFIRSEPELFTEMLRLRIGLIQHVMVSELSRAMGCTRE